MTLGRYVGLVGTNVHVEYEYGFGSTSIATPRGIAVGAIPSHMDFSVVID